MGDFTDSIRQLSTTSTEFKTALKVLIKYEINCLLKRLSDTGEEAIIITTSVEDGVQGQLGTTKGEGFLQATNHVTVLKEQFLQFCTNPTLSLSDETDTMSERSPVDFSKKPTHAGVQSVPKEKIPARTNHHFDQRDYPGNESDSYKSSTPTNHSNMIREIPDSLTRNHPEATNDEECKERMDSEAVLSDKAPSKSQEERCMMNREKLYPLEPRNTESTYFQESELHGIVCKKEEVQKMFEKGDDAREANRKSSTPLENGTCVNNTGQRNNEALHQEEAKRSRSPAEEYCGKKFRDHTNHTNGKSMPYRKGSCPRAKHLSTMRDTKDYNTQEKHVYTNDHSDSEMHTSLYNDIASQKMLGFYPAINSDSKKHIVSRRDLESLHQFYFGRMNDDFDGELLDCSLKKEIVSKDSSDEDSMTTEDTMTTVLATQRSKLETCGSHQRLELKGHSNSECMSTGRDDHVSCKRFVDCKPNREMNSIEKQRSDKTVKRTKFEGMGAYYRDRSITGGSENELMEMNSELCEPMNLKIEPDERPEQMLPSVKIEPGTESLNTIEKMLADPNMPNYTLQGQGQGHSPTSSLTMHLNFSCKICGQNFKNRQYRDFHVRLHQSAHHYYCNLCSAGFDNEAECKSHQSEHREPVFQCESCGYRCTREFRMRAHKEICGSPSKIFKCPFCYKQFAAQRYMRIHIKSHDAHNVHTCPVCHNTYPLKNSLLKHMKKKHYQS